jgi:hypothetical protein
MVYLANFPLPQRGWDLGTEELVQQRIQGRNRLEPTNEQLDQIQTETGGNRQGACEEYWTRLKPEMSDKLLPPVGSGCGFDSGAVLRGLIARTGLRSRMKSRGTR